MTINTVKTASFTMDYLRFGKGKDSLVILPGLSVQSVMGLGDLIAEAYQVLTEDFTIYLFDRRKDLPAVYPIREMARDMAEAIRALGLSKVALFGASQGGMIAMALAAEHPELVQKLVLGSSSAHVDAAHFELFARWIDLAKEGQSRELNLAFGEALYPEAVFEGARELLLSQADTLPRRICGVSSSWRRACAALMCGRIWPGSPARCWCWARRTTGCWAPRQAGSSSAICQSGPTAHFISTHRASATPPLTPRRTTRSACCAFSGKKLPQNKGIVA